MKKLLLLSALFVQLSAATLNVAVAANVSYAMDQLKATFMQQHPDIDLHITLGGSGKLIAQIANGAPYDLFLSANMHYPQALYKQGLAYNKPVVYAKGALALFSKKERDFTAGLDLLTKADIRRIAMANPKTAPYGQAAMQALKRAKLYERLKPKIIYGESIAQTLLYTLTAADLGLVAKSALYSQKLQHFQEGRNWITLDPHLYNPIEQGVVILTRAKNKPEAQLFYDFILSPEAQTIFRAYGYTL